jgi:sialic acid synthase
MKNYPEYNIGYSDHTIGISMPIAAVSMGAKIIEKHITIDRKLKGTDQAGSLGLDGIHKMLRDLRLLELSLGEENIFIASVVENNRLKLERSIATNRSVKAGEIISQNDIHLLSPGDGFRWLNKDNVIGKKLLFDIGKDEIIYEKFIKT